VSEWVVWGLRAGVRTPAETSNAVPANRADKAGPLDLARALKFTK